MKIVLLFFLILFSSYSYSQTGHSTFHYEVHGNVFYDQNLNGIKDGNEWGIGGVALLITDGISSISDEHGHFKISTSSKRADTSLTIDKKSLPSGSVLTSPDRFFLNPQASFYRDFNFGIKYPEAKITFAIPHIVDKKKFFYLPRTISAKLSLREDGIYINENNWKKLASKKRLSTKTLNLDYDEPSLFLTPKSLRLLRGAITDSVTNVSITVVANHHDDSIALKKATTVADEVRIKLLRQSIDRDNISINTSIGTPKIEVNLTYVNSRADHKCRFTSLDDKPFSLSTNESKIVTWPLSETRKYYLYCTNNNFNLSLPSLIIKNTNSGWNPASALIDPSNNQSVSLNLTTDPKTAVIFDSRDINNLLSLSLFSLEENILLTLVNDKNNFSVPLRFAVPFYYSDLIKKQQGTLELYSPKHIDESRDLDIHFRGVSTNLKSAIIHGRTYHKKNFGYLHKGKRGSNSLYISLEDLNKKKLRKTNPFTLFPEPKYKLQINWGEHKKSSSANFYKTSYALPLVEFFDTSFQYFPSLKWGVSLFFRTDIIPTEISTMTSGSVQVRHTDIQVHAAKRYFLNESSFYSPKLIFYGGLQSKSFLSDESVVINYPEPFLGVHGGTEFLAEHVVFDFLDTSTKAMIGVSFLNLGDVTVQLSQEFRFDLNVFGLLTPIKPYYNRTYRYRYLQQFDFVLGIHFEKDLRTVANVSENAMINETKWLFTLGLTFHY